MDLDSLGDSDTSLIKLVPAKQCEAKIGTYHYLQFGEDTSSEHTLSDVKVQLSESKFEVIRCTFSFKFQLYRLRRILVPERWVP